MKSQLLSMQNPACRQSLRCVPSRATPGRIRRSALSVKAQATVPLTISVKYKTKFGESVKVIGSGKEMGAWEASRSLALSWSDGHIWSVTADIPVGVEIRFKLLMESEEGATWEDGNDRTLTALGPEYGLKAKCQWNETERTEVEAYKLSKTAQQSPRHASASNSGNGNSPSSSHDKQRELAAAAAAAKEMISYGGGGSSSLSSIEELARGESNSSWVGGDIEFTQHRKDRVSRTGQWNKEGLEGSVLEIVQGDEKSSNWLSKLEVMKRLIVDKPAKMRPDLDALAACYVYSTWVNNGALPSIESGGHHRPNHHANLSLAMFRSLEWTISDALPFTAPGTKAEDRAAAEARVIAARRMHGRLPSISGQFRQSVPLTRIRDIAHRGDIPKELKNEIKHTLQNKLHRCAGPEDLVATEKMLERVTRHPGEYSDSFVHEFKIFTQELREFFNATGLLDLVQSTQGSLDEQHSGAVSTFLTTMAQVEASGTNARLDELMNLLQTSTQARTFYVRGLSAGLRNDVTDDVLSMRQRWRLCDTRLEEFNFVVLSRIINALEGQGGHHSLSKSGNKEWSVPMAALVAGLRNMGLGQFAPRELFALENELQAWHGAGPYVETPEASLRAKATVERVLRLANEYGDAVMNVYADTARKMGTALGLPEYMSSIFGEGEIRASVAFQVSKLATMMIKAFRAAANMDSWDGLVTGDSVGVLKEVASLSPEAMEGVGEEGVILLVRSAEGDEELGPLGSKLRGVILRQDLPHLSHLGVRARQERVTFATCDDEDYVSGSIKPLLGKLVRLNVTQEGVTLSEADASAASAARAPATTAAARGGKKDSAGPRPAVKLVSSPTLLPLLKARVESCGSKATKCAELEQLAVNSKGLFKTAKGCALPFGNMDVAIKSAGVESEYKKILEELEQKDLDGTSLDLACARMQRLVEGLPLPPALITQVADTFDAESLLAVRSSANVEDLAGMSAAGLYESIIGVSAADAAAVMQAVTAVWASLYTRRAVLSRRAAGVPQAAASMGVLIQELHVPEVSFVLHTARPSDANNNVLVAEAAPGQGETLAAATRGTPWRFEFDKSCSKVETKAFANFSRALMMPPKGLTLADGTKSGLVELEVDYSKQKLSSDPDYREQVVRRIAKVGMVIEGHFNREAQDIECGLVAVPGSSTGPLAAGGGSNELEVYVFQTRPQN